jgi:two-component system sensor histidine kinase BaeS
MKVWTLIQQRLRWKLFVSYAVIVVVGSAVLLATAQWRAPAVITHHTARMESMMGSMMGGTNATLEQDWRASFMDSLNEIMAAAVAAAMLAAFLMSLYVSRRTVEPVRQMRFASQHIAQGDYHKRIQIVSRDELGDLASAFNQMAQDLKHTEQRRLELVGNVAHELRTPLGSLQAMMEGLIDGVLPGEPARNIRKLITGRKTRENVN